MNIEVKGAHEHNLQGVNVTIPRGAVTVVTGVSGSGKSSLVFDTILSEAQRRFFYTLSHYSRQFLDVGTRPKVRSVSGLSPAIGLAQNETQPSKRASVGTLTDMAELLAVLFAQFGTRLCPEHQLVTSSLTAKQMVDAVREGFADKLVAICAPVAEQKKGQFRKKLESFVTKGYLKVYLDGKTLNLSPLPEPAKEEKHTLKLIVDYVHVKEGAEKRLLRSIETALLEGEGVIEIIPADAKGQLKLDGMMRLSASEGCPLCHFSWPTLDARFFSANSLGKCESCEGYGCIGQDEFEDEGDDDEEDTLASAALLAQEVCPECRGCGIDPQFAAIKLDGLSVHEAHLMPLHELDTTLRQIKQPALLNNPAFGRVMEELLAILQRVQQIGLRYLSLARRVRSLSGGEAQRLKLASLLSENLRGVLYVLDEPSQGLHPSELQELFSGLQRLKDLGNTILMVEHDDFLIRRADWVVDMGPGGGRQGGQVLACFHPSQAAEFQDRSLTAKYLHAGAMLPPRSKEASKAQKAPEFFEVKGARLHNLRIPAVRFLQEGFNVVSGVSGAGKSSLVLSTFYPLAFSYLAAEQPSLRLTKNKHCDGITGLEDWTSIELIDRRPIAKSSVSMPATYLDVFSEVRKFYEKLPEAQLRGLMSRAFSLHVDAGRCPECKGRGEVLLTMKFLADARVRCSICHGKRYQNHILEILYRGLSIADVLELTIDEALEHFRNHSAIVKRLQPAHALGLGYLKLGQPSSSLSGGEAQRLKLVPFLSRWRGGREREGKKGILLLEEPTQGLHSEDIQRLIAALKELVAVGMTVLLVEHSREVIAAADWVVDLGPGAAEKGGQVVYQGPVSGLTRCTESVTGKYFALGGTHV